MSDDVSKLPDFPLHASDEFHDMEFKAHALTLERDAYRARMEALVEYTQHADDCEKWDPENEGLSDTLHCDCGLSALLAACDRDKS